MAQNKARSGAKPDTAGLFGRCNYDVDKKGDVNHNLKCNVII